MSQHVTEKKVKENILMENSLPSNIKGTYFGQLYQITFIGK